MGLRERFGDLFSDGSREMVGAVDCLEDQVQTTIHEIHLGDTTVRLKVPVNYRRMDGDDPDCATFNEKDKARLAFCRIEEAYEDESIDEFMEDELEIEVDHKNTANESVKGEFIQGRMYHYYVHRFKSGFSHFQKIYAACDLGKGKFYTVEMTILGLKEELTMGALLPFLDFEIG